MKKSSFPCTLARQLVVFIFAFLYCVAVIQPAMGKDQPQWGLTFSRNMVSNEIRLPDSLDPAAGRNIKWIAPLGSETYATPVVSGGKVLIGTNNEQPRDPRHKGDRGILLCLDEKDGSLCWQLVVPKFIPMLYRDWPKSGICSPATVEGNNIYIVSNRGEVMCLDINGQANGNDGPYLDESRHMTPDGDKLIDVAPNDADILWLYDMQSELGVHQHDSAHSSILIEGDFLYVNTSNGLDDKHSHIPATGAPSMIVLDKRTGRLVARDNENIGPKIFHCTWSSPTLSYVNGRTSIILCGGDGVCYGLAPIKSVPPEGQMAKLSRLWRFDCDPKAPKENVHNYIRNRNESPSNIKSMAVFHDNRVYVTYGGDIWWGKHEAWLKCFDAAGSGDITDSAELWSYPVSRHCCSTPSVYNGMIFVADCGGFVHCVDARTGQAYWTHDTGGDIWASTLVADGKVYIGTRRGDFFVFDASKQKNIISSIRLDSRINGSPVAANGVLYITTMKNLYAVEASAR